MATILNPIIPGMAPDPSILRVGDDYYIATSTFHWQPAVQVFHSTDFVNWELLTYLLKDGEVNLQGTNTPAGIWAPHLSYDTAAKKFWLIYSHMQNMAGREFNAEAYAMSADDIMGPWSKPIYITSIGFDPSLYHENGRHYVACLEWETRTGYQAPGHLAIAEADLAHGGIKGRWHRITTNFTTRVTFHPDHYSETAGAGLYYDANNWIYAHLAFDPKEERIELSILQAKLGARVADDSAVAEIPSGTVDLKLDYEQGMLTISYREPQAGAEGEWHILQQNVNAAYLSDEGVNGEPGEIGGFTGLFNFLGSVDAHQHDSVAVFDHYDVVNH